VRDTVEAGHCVIVGDEDADPAVARVVEVKADGVVLLRVLPALDVVPGPCGMPSGMSAEAEGWVPPKVGVAGAAARAGRRERRSPPRALVPQ